MNTPSHLILNLAMLRRPTAPNLTWPILIGAFVPDAALFLFYAWAKGVQRLPESVIWSEAYYSQPWQDVFAIGNSIPLAVIGAGLGVWLKRPALAVLAASMILHHLEDLPLHHDDAHRHFFPFSNLRVISPVSYWDTEHYGWLGASIEFALVLGAGLYLWPRLTRFWAKGILAITVLLVGLAYGGLLLFS